MSNLTTFIHILILGSTNQGKKCIVMIGFVGTNCCTFLFCCSGGNSIKTSIPVMKLIPLVNPPLNLSRS